MITILNCFLSHNSSTDPSTDNADNADNTDHTEKYR